MYETLIAIVNQKFATASVEMSNKNIATLMGFYAICYGIYWMLCNIIEKSIILNKFKDPIAALKSKPLHWDEKLHQGLEMFFRASSALPCVEDVSEISPKATIPTKQSFSTIGSLRICF